VWASERGIHLRLFSDGVSLLPFDYNDFFSRTNKLQWPEGFANASGANKTIEVVRRIAGLQVFFLISPISGLLRILVYCD